MNAEPRETWESPSRFTHEEWPYEPRFKRVNGWRMHYVDEGDGGNNLGLAQKKQTVF